MLLKELREILNRVSRHDEDEIRVLLNSPSIGPRASCGLKTISFGFDWEMGKVLLTPDSPLVIKTKKEALWDLAHDFIYMLSNDRRVRNGKEYETDLSKRASKIIKMATEEYSND